MTCPHTAKPATALADDGLASFDRSGRRINFKNTDITSKGQDALPLIGRGNRFFGLAILTAWSPGALAAMDVRWRSTGERVCREVSR